MDLAISNAKLDFRERSKSSCFRYWRAKVTSSLQKYQGPNWLDWWQSHKWWYVDLLLVYFLLFLWIWFLNPNLLVQIFLFVCFVFVFVFCFVFPSHWDTDLCTLNRLCLAVGEINLFLILQPLNHTWCDVHLSPLPLLSPWTIFFKKLYSLKNNLSNLYVKQFPAMTSVDMQMTHFEAWSEMQASNFGFLWKG